MSQKRVLFIGKRARGVWEFYPVTELLASGTLSTPPVCFALAASGLGKPSISGTQRITRTSFT